MSCTVPGHRSKLVFVVVNSWQSSRRAEKFGTAHMPIQTPKHPGPLRDELRKERLQKKDVVCTGFDLYSEEERAKQSKRASRFGTSMPAEGIAIAKLGSDEQAKKNRAMKFGVHYEEAERSGTRLSPRAQLQAGQCYVVHCVT